MSLSADGVRLNFDGAEVVVTVGFNNQSGTEAVTETIPIEVGGSRRDPETITVPPFGLEVVRVRAPAPRDATLNIMVGNQIVEVPPLR